MAAAALLIAAAALAIALAAFRRASIALGRLEIAEEDIERLQTRLGSAERDPGLRRDRPGNKQEAWSAERDDA